ncbi:MAG: 50S ribosomal protein L13 [Candidatus Aenigmatarchaeota archaeon]|nr:MAG: 50S ribosomal protein L13 [Candidatus Aenigmarchaeota archaeon]
MMYIDAKDMILGRLASATAKKLLNGESVCVVNAEKSVIVGRPETIIAEYKEKRARGDPYHGPFFPRTPDRIFKRTVRGMLPYKTARGSEALKRLKVFISIPAGLKDKEFTAVKDAENKGEQKFITLEKLSGLI